MAAGALPLADALHYAIATAEAVRMMHARGRPYAMLQPSNIFIRNDQVQLVPSGAVPISPYFSPEQVSGCELDFRSDIFSIGALLYEMLSGHKAFGASTKPALRFEILDCEPPPLGHFPPAISQLVMRCLEKRPERRIQRMENLLAALKLQEIIARSATAAGH
jgi:serine/threonine protein kinase